MLPEKSSPSTKLTKEKQKKQETIKAEVRDALQLGENPGGDYLRRATNQDNTD